MDAQSRAEQAAQDINDHALKDIGYSAGGSVFQIGTAERIIYNAITAALAEAPLPWVPVTERVPESSFDLLVLLDDGFWHMGHYSPKARRFETVDSIGFDAKATHWAEVLLPAGVRAR